MLDDLASRRSVLRGAAMAAVAGVAGFLVARNSSLTKPKAPTTQANGYGPAPTTGTYLTPLDKVPVDGGVILASQAVVLVREPDGVLKGFSAICTHQGCTVGSIANGIITCPCHGSEYSTLNGAVVRGPAPRPLPPVAVVVRDGDVYELG